VNGNDLTGEIIGAAIEIHRHLGPGLLESAYEACMSNYSPQSWHAPLYGYTEEGTEISNIISETGENIAILVLHQGDIDGVLYPETVFLAITVLLNKKNLCVLRVSVANNYKNE